MTPDLERLYGIVGQLVQAYVDGWNGAGARKKLKRAFHENVWMFYSKTKAGALDKVALDDHEFEKWANRGYDAVFRVLSVRQMGDAASVAIGMGTEYFGLPQPAEDRRRVGESPTRRRQARRAGDQGDRTPLVRGARRHVWLSSASNWCDVRWGGCRPRSACAFHDGPAAVSSGADQVDDDSAAGQGLALPDCSCAWVPTGNPESAHARDNDGVGSRPPKRPISVPFRCRRF